MAEYFHIIPRQSATEFPLIIIVVSGEISTTAHGGMLIIFGSIQGRPHTAHKGNIPANNSTIKEINAPTPLVFLPMHEI
ncbi:MAG: hypothetical protein KHZ68_08905 [Rothia mucilaginosa]|uniref:hypothetical protein n=1 Tax=Rothia mucilaginosa TaxID=43675 RepID=UPI0026F26DA7|nr:hypothetical protein [Rothia mucilaginosa]MBS4941751.1 hypothetical protein [Rothia mucilaginosa]